MEIKALFWKQPYANLMLHGKIETRTWNTNYRGLVLICASKIPYTNHQVKLISDINQVYNTLGNETIKLGCAIAVGKLVDCRLMQPDDEEKCFVKYSPNLYCHIYEDVKAIEPFELKGQMGWMNITDDILNKIKYK